MLCSNESGISRIKFFFFIVYRTSYFKEQQKSKYIVSSLKLESQIGNEKVVGISISKADPIYNIVDCQLDCLAIQPSSTLKDLILV